MFSSPRADGIERKSDTLINYFAFFLGCLCLALMPFLFLFKFFIWNDSLTLVTNLENSYFMEDIEFLGGGYLGILLFFSFPFLTLFYFHVLHRRISLQWLRRYPIENYQKTHEDKHSIFPKIFFIPVSIMFFVYLSSEFSVFEVLLGIILGACCSRIYDCYRRMHVYHPVVDGHTLDERLSWIKGIIYTTAFFVIFLMCWLFSLMLTIFYYDFLSDLRPDLMLLVGALVFLVAFFTYINTYEKLREIKRWREDIKTGEKSTAFESLQELLRNPSTPFLFPRGLKFLTLTNSEYSWENQSNPDTVLSLIYTHKHKVVVINIFSLLAVFICPPIIVFYLIDIPPPHLTRPMSDTLRKKYDDIIERSKEFFNIQYDEYGIKKISARFGDQEVLVRSAEDLNRVWNAFCFPEANLTTGFFIRLEDLSYRLERLEMIRDKGVMYAPNSPMNLLVDALGLQDRLSRHTKKLQLDHFEEIGKRVEIQLNNNQNKSALEERLSEQVSELKDRLEKHETLLNRIADEGNWRYVYSENRTSSALNDIRTCTEKLLYSRCEIIGKKIPERRRSLDALISLLKSDKVADLDNTGAKHASVIKEFVNPASHNLTASDSDYLKALDSFVQLVEWHVENPPEKTNPAS